MALCIIREQERHQYAQPWDDYDVILKVEDEKFHVHSMILGLASPVFKAMLSTNFKEGKEKVINLPGKDKASFLILLNLIYPINFKIKDFSCCESLLELAREYDIKGIMLLVDDFLTFEVACSFDVLKIANYFDLTKTLKKHVEYYGKAKVSVGLHFCYFFSPGVTKNNWSTISEKTRLRILYKKTKNLEGNNNQSNCDSKYCGHSLSLSQHELVTLVDAIEAFGKNV